MSVGWLYAWLYGLCPYFVGIFWFCWLCPYSHYYIILFPSPYSEMQPWFGTGSVLFGVPSKRGIWYMIWLGDGIVLTAWFFYTQQDVYAILAIAYHNVPGPSGGTCVQRDCDTEGGGPFWPTLKYGDVSKPILLYLGDEHPFTSYLGFTRVPRFWLIPILLQWLWQNIGYHKPNGLVIWSRNPRNPSLWLGSNVVVHTSNVFIVHACGKPNHTQWNFSLGCNIFLRPSILVITPILVRQTLVTLPWLNKLWLLEPKLGRLALNVNTWSSAKLSELEKRWARSPKIS